MKQPHHQPKINEAASASTINQSCSCSIKTVNHQAAAASTVYQSRTAASIINQSSSWSINN
jgi:hypothetical protein